MRATAPADRLSAPEAASQRMVVRARLAGGRVGGMGASGGSGRRTRGLGQPPLVGLARVHHAAVCRAGIPRARGLVALADAPGRHTIRNDAGHGPPGAALADGSMLHELRLRSVLPYRGLWCCLPRGFTPA